MKLSEELIETIGKEIEDGLSNRDACRLHDITEQTFYGWIAKAHTAQSVSRKTPHQRLCIKFAREIHNARIRRKKNLVQTLQKMDHSPASAIFLLKNISPSEFNREPYKVLNFDRLESYMESEYTEDEIQAVRDAIFKAEDRRMKEIQYDENESFEDTGDSEGNDE